MRPRSTLCEQWRSDPLVPERPLDREDRSTTDTLAESVLLDFLTWNLEGRSSVALDVLDEVAATESCCCRVDPSSSKSRVTPELELRFPAESSSCWARHTGKTTHAVMRRPAIRSTMHIPHLALLTGSEQLSTQVGIKDILCHM